MDRRSYLSWSAFVVTLACVLINSIQPTSSQVPFKGRVVMCYWASWSVYRMGNSKFDTNNINPSLCSHLLYMFAGLRGDNLSPPYTIYSMDPWGDVSDCGMGLGNYNNALALKKKNPNLKVLIAIGGYNAGSQVFSNMTLTAERRQTFIASVVKFVLQYDFDGLSLDWQYPAMRDGRPEDRPNFTLLVKELRKAFDGIVREPGKGALQLTASLPAKIANLETGYELIEIAKYLDYVNVMSFDYHMFDDGPYLYHHSGMDNTNTANDKDNNNNIRSTVAYIINQGVPARQLVLGVATYGHGFTMSDASKNEIFDSASGKSQVFPTSVEAGTFYYYEVCKEMMDKNYTTIRHPSVVAPYAYGDRFWYGFDDPNSVMAKAQYIVQLKMAGAMIWSIDTDDFLNLCEGISANPIATTIRMVFESSAPLK